uniref:Uncharacterized protein n=1 Tax=Sphaerodactylus townsendi TaxID=933632 RepID=A0ACB8G6R0_9SAUR
MIYARCFAKAQGCLRLRSLLLRQCLAELLGDFMLIVITLSAAAQSITSEGTKGGYMSSALAGGVGVMVAIYVSGGVSGEIGGRVVVFPGKSSDKALELLSTICGAFSHPMPLSLSTLAPVIT